MKTELIGWGLLIAVVAYFLYKLEQVFGSNGASYCNDNPDAYLCQLFGGGEGSGGAGKACIGLGCSGALVQSYCCSSSWLSFCCSSTSSPSLSTSAFSADETSGIGS